MRGTTPKSQSHTKATSIHKCALIKENLKSRRKPRNPNTKHDHNAVRCLCELEEFRAQYLSAIGIHATRRKSRGTGRIYGKGSAGSIEDYQGEGEAKIFRISRKSFAQVAEIRGQILTGRVSTRSRFANGENKIDHFFLIREKRNEIFEKLSYIAI